MTMKTRIAAAGLLALSALGLATTAARADNHGDTDAAATAQAFAAATVTLPQAIAAAEADTGGKAMAVEFDAGENGQPAAFDVDVLMADGTMMEMVVNAADGAVAPDTDEVRRCWRDTAPQLVESLISCRVVVVRVRAGHWLGRTAGALGVPYLHLCETRKRTALLIRCSRRRVLSHIIAGTPRVLPRRPSMSGEPALARRASLLD